MDKDSNINVITTSYCSKTPLTIFSSFKTVSRTLKSVKDLRSWKNIQFCRFVERNGLRQIYIFPSRKLSASCPGKGDFALLLLTSFEKLLGFLLYLSLQSLIVTNDFRIWTPRTRWILRTSWTPDIFVSRKVRLLKIIKTDSVINITRAYTEIFPKTDTKKQHFLPKKDRYISVRCVILKAKHGVWKFFGKLYWNLFSLDKDSNINVITTSYSSKTPLTIFSTFKTVYRALKSVNQPSIMEKYPILHICRTAWFKID